MSVVEFPDREDEIELTLKVKPKPVTITVPRMDMVPAKTMRGFRKWSEENEDAQLWEFYVHVFETLAPKSSTALELLTPNEIGLVWEQYQADHEVTLGESSGSSDS